MKLYELPRGSLFKVDMPGCPGIWKFHRTDGMYSYCTLHSMPEEETASNAPLGTIEHWAVYTPVILVEELADEVDLPRH